MRSGIYMTSIVYTTLCKSWFSFIVSGKLHVLLCASSLPIHQLQFCPNIKWPQFCGRNFFQRMFWMFTPISLNTIHTITIDKSAFVKIMDKYRTSGKPLHEPRLTQSSQTCASSDFSVQMNIIDCSYIVQGPWLPSKIHVKFHFSQQGFF